PLHVHAVERVRSRSAADGVDVRERELAGIERGLRSLPRELLAVLLRAPDEARHAGADDGDAAPGHDPLRYSMSWSVFPSGSRNEANRANPSTPPTCWSNATPRSCNARIASSRSPTSNTAVAPPVGTACPSCTPWRATRIGPPSNSAQESPLRRTSSRPITSR